MVNHNAIILLGIFVSSVCSTSIPSVVGLRPKDSLSTLDSKGRLSIPVNKRSEILLFGTALDGVDVTFSRRLNSDDPSLCERDSVTDFTIRNNTDGSFSVTVRFELEGKWKLCLLHGPELLHQDSEYLRVISYTFETPIYWFILKVMAVVLLLCLSGLFSGLNLGLMALNPDELQVVENVGTESEKRYAKKIIPVRKSGNFLLCTLLLGNVLVNTSATVLLDEITGSGAWAIVGSAAGIVIFGEIIPQSVCTRHGLMIGAKTLWLTRFFMVATFLISFPLSKILDCLFGEEIGARYNRDKFIEMAKLIQRQGDENFDKDVVNIISGAFDMKQKIVKDIMTPIEKVFMLDYNEALTFELLTKISDKGFTRIPVFQDSETNIVGLIFVKDLMFIDPSDNMPVRAVCDNVKHDLIYVYEDTTLDYILAEFKTGSSHMAFVQKVVNVNDQDPYYVITGVVTLEDVIEEMIGSEILDETDYFVDNTGQDRIKRRSKRPDFKSFLNQPSNNTIQAPLRLACYQFLVSEIKAFTPDLINGNVVKKLLERGNVLFEMKLDQCTENELILYQKDVPADYFIMIIEGRALVQVGKSNLRFEAGPFHAFGADVLSLTGGTCEGQDGTDAPGLPRNIQDLRRPSINSFASSHKDAPTAPAVNYANIQTHHNFVPDFTVIAKSDLVLFRITRSHYLAAYRASRVINEQEATHPKAGSDEPSSIGTVLRDAIGAGGGGGASSAADNTGVEKALQMEFKRLEQAGEAAAASFEESPAVSKLDEKTEGGGVLPPDASLVLDNPRVTFSANGNNAPETDKESQATNDNEPAPSSLKAAAEKRGAYSVKDSHHDSLPLIEHGEPPGGINDSNATPEDV